MKYLLPALLLFAVQDDSPGDALVVEWNVRWVARDSLDRSTEIHRKERLTILPDRMRIDDLTFGTTWIIRGDLEKVWIIDPFRKEYSELSFEAVLRRQNEIAAGLRDAARRVPGTKDEKSIRRVLEGMGRYEKKPDVELKETDDDEQSLVINGEIHQMTLSLDKRHKAPGYFALLGKIGAYPPAVTDRLNTLPGFPVRGTMRYLFFGERVTVRFEVLTIGKKPVKAELFDRTGEATRIPLKGFEPAPRREIERPKSLTSDFDEDDIDRKRREDMMKKKDKP